MAVDIDKYTGATLSEDRRHRLALHRIWTLNDDKNHIMFIGVNPSTADANKNDSTIIRCMDFASRWGYSGMYMGNLFSFRATDIKDLKVNFKKAVHTETNYHLIWMAGQCKTVVFCWGAKPFAEKRIQEVIKLLNHKKPMCFRLTQDGYPEHPLFLPKTTKLTPYECQKKESK